jgi:fructose-bisphosphate aldolase class II
MKTLKEYIKEAEEKKVAIGHFNVSDITAFHAIVSAASKLRIPVLIGLSEGERKFFGTKEAVALVRSLREQNLPVFLNADHAHSLESVKEAVEAGYDSVIFDAAQLSFEENLRQTRDAVEYVKSKNPEILVEGELGYIGTSSEIFEEIPEGAAAKPEDFTSVGDAARFVKETGVDLFAPAVGNIQGMRKNSPNPTLDTKRIGEIKKAVGVPLVLHGGSGIQDEDFVKAIEAGISIIHINTELRKAWRQGVEEALQENPDEVAPYRLLAPAFDKIEQLVESRLRLFNRS